MFLLRVGLCRPARLLRLMALHMLSNGGGSCQTPLGGFGIDLTLSSADVEEHDGPFRHSRWRIRRDLLELASVALPPVRAELEHWLEPVLRLEGRRTYDDLRCAFGLCEQLHQRHEQVGRGVRPDALHPSTGTPEDALRESICARGAVGVCGGPVAWEQRGGWRGEGVDRTRATVNGEPGSGKPMCESMIRYLPLWTGFHSTEYVPSPWSCTRARVRVGPLMFTRKVRFVLGTGSFVLRSSASMRKLAVSRTHAFSRPVPDATQT